MPDRAPGQALQGALHETGDEGAAFWRFSLALYARPGIAEALIALQDRAGLDVNLILFGLWVGARHGLNLESDRIAAATEAIAELNGVVRNIRPLRRQLGAADSDIRRLRRALLQLELAAERQVQRRLALCVAAGPLPQASGDRRSAAQANLARYLGDESESPEAAALRRELAALTRRT
ncbi:MAG TPA: TIGR02444 family protein [Stellaceae bacterium]|nr:TIGR02444 family protein [Stellaceae bacterium]